MSAITDWASAVAAIMSAATALVAWKTSKDLGDTQTRLQNRQLEQEARAATHGERLQERQLQQNLFEKRAAIYFTTTNFIGNMGTNSRSYEAMRVASERFMEETATAQFIFTKGNRIREFLQELRNALGQLTMTADEARSSPSAETMAKFTTGQSEPYKYFEQARELFEPDLTLTGTQQPTS